MPAAAVVYCTSLEDPQWSALMPRMLIDVARDLAKAHRRADGQTSVIKLVPVNGKEEIRLVEVSGSAPTTGEPFPYRFEASPAAGVDYPSTVILLSPEEWESVERGDLALPAGWDLTRAEDL